MLKCVNMKICAVININILMCTAHKKITLKPARFLLVRVASLCDQFVLFANSACKCFTQNS